MLPDLEFNIIPPTIKPAEIELSINSTVRIDFDVSVEMGSAGRLPDYDGSYEVTPRLVEQVLPTKDKSMTDDLTVKEIGVLRVTNPSGGDTVTIGID